MAMKGPKDGGSKRTKAYKQLVSAKMNKGKYGLSSIPGMDRPVYGEGSRPKENKDKVKSAISGVKTNPAARNKNKAKAAVSGIVTSKKKAALGILGGGNEMGTRGFGGTRNKAAKKAAPKPPFGERPNAAKKVAKKTSKNPLTSVGGYKGKNWTGTAKVKAKKISVGGMTLNRKKK